MQDVWEQGSCTRTCAVRQYAACSCRHHPLGMTAIPLGPSPHPFPFPFSSSIRQAAPPHPHPILTIIATATSSDHTPIYHPYLWLQLLYPLLHRSPGPILNQLKTSRTNVVFGPRRLERENDELTTFELPSSSLRYFASPFLAHAWDD